MRMFPLVGLVCLGPAAGSALWLAGLYLQPSDDELTSLRDRVEAASVRLGGHNLRDTAAPALLTGSLFRPGDMAKPPMAGALRLEGVVVSLQGRGALISIDSRPAVWFNEGESHDGVTLRRVVAGAALVDTFDGSRRLALGADPLGSAGANSNTHSDTPPGV